MRNLVAITGIIAIAAVSVVLTGCNKENIVYPKSEINEEETPMVFKVATGFSNLRVLVKVVKEYDCKDSGGNCLPDVIVALEILL